MKEGRERKLKGRETVVQIQVERKASPGKKSFVSNTAKERKKEPKNKKKYMYDRELESFAEKCTTHGKK